MTTIKYPLSVSATGDLLLSDNDRAAPEAILSSLNTRTGERVYRPSYGNSIDELATISDLSRVLGGIEDAIGRDCSEYVPLTVAVEGEINDDGVASATCYYTTEEVTAKVATILT